MCVSPLLQLRETVFNFFQKELAPYADQIDRDNGWAGQRVSSLDQTNSI